MKFDYDRAFSLIDNLVNQNTNVTSGMNQLIDIMESYQPDEVWHQIRTLDFEADLSRLHHWLKNTLSEEPPKGSIIAYWFGITNPILEDGMSSCDLYISGSQEYDYSDETNEWSCLTDDSYLPTNHNAQSVILHQIYRILQQTSFLSVGEYVLCLGFGCLVINLLVNQLKTELLRGSSVDRAIVVGFDSGDWVTLGLLSPQGLRAIEK